MTQSEKVARELESFWLGRRGVGHTTAMVKGANNSKEGTIVVGATLNILKGLQSSGDLEGCRLMSLGQIANGSLRGHEAPLVLDHHALRVLLQGLINELEKARK